MLLSDGEIKDAMDKGRIGVKPYTPAQLQPASYDVTLGSKFLIQRAYNTPAIFPWDRQQTLMESVTIRDNQTFTLHPGKFALATTIEEIFVDDLYAAQVGGKSSLGRMGLVVHATAGFIDPGFCGQVTLELANMGELPIQLREGMPIGQILFMQLGREAQVPYKGKYQNQRNTTESRYYENYEG